MAQLGIRDKDYRPNQYINPMLISQKKEPAMGYGPYKIFDKNNPEHPDYKADDDDDEDMQLSLPLDYVKNKRNQDMTIASTPPTGGGYTTANGGIVDLMGRVFYNDNGVLRYDGTYDEAIHGEIMPGIGLDQANQSMQINPDVAMFPRLSTGEPMTNIEKKQGIEVLRKTRDPKQIKLFIQQMMKGV